MPGWKAAGSEQSRPIRVDPGVARDVEELLHDPQTSGGLLVAVAPALVARFGEELATRGVTAWRIGRLTAGPVGRIAVAA